jgi:hypothetical protein
VSENLPTKEQVPQTREEIELVFEQAKAGDESVVEQVREILVLCPRMIEVFGGDLTKITERLLSTAVAGEDVAFRESIKQKMAVLRQELAGPNANPLELLLVDRIVVCWLQVQMEDIAQAKGGGQDIRLAAFRLHRQESANRRYLAAIRTLATVRKMALPALQINIGQNQMNTAGGA